MQHTAVAGQLDAVTACVGAQHTMAHACSQARHGSVQGGTLLAAIRAAPNAQAVGTHPKGSHVVLGPLDLQRVAAEGDAVQLQRRRRIRRVAAERGGGAGRMV